jgi:hypothetical protein
MHFGGMEVKAVMHQMIRRYTWHVPAGYSPPIGYGTGPVPIGGVRFPRFSGVFEDWFDLANQEGRLCCQHRESTPMSCGNGRFGSIWSLSRGRRFAGWVSS